MNDRLKARISKLETKTGSADRMTFGEIEIAAAGYERKLRGEGVPDTASVKDALTIYRRTLDGIPDGAVQRAVAGFDPIDFEL